MAKIRLQDVEKAVVLGKQFFPFVAPVIMAHAPQVVDQVQKKAKQTVGGAEEAKGVFRSKIQQRKDEKDRKAALDTARKNAVASALPPIPAKDFFKNFEANTPEGGDLDRGYMAITGCYAILTLKASGEKDLSAFKDVYVGCSETVGFSVYSQFRGCGNVDVYADFKFGEPMKVLIYPCEGDEMESRFAGLVQDYQAVGSYNRWDLLRFRDSES